MGRAVLEARAGDRRGAAVAAQPAPLPGRPGPVRAGQPGRGLLRRRPAVRADRGHRAARRRATAGPGLGSLGWLATWRSVQLGRDGRGHQLDVIQIGEIEELQVESARTRRPELVDPVHDLVRRSAEPAPPQCLDGLADGVRAAPYLSLVTSTADGLRRGEHEARRVTVLLFAFPKDAVVAGSRSPTVPRTGR